MTLNDKVPEGESKHFLHIGNLMWDAHAEFLPRERRGGATSELLPMLLPSKTVCRETLGILVSIGGAVA